MTKEQLTQFNPINCNPIKRAIFDENIKQRASLKILTIMDSGNSIYNVRSISKMTGASTASVSRALKELEEQGYIHNVRGSFHIKSSGIVSSKKQIEDKSVSCKKQSVSCTKHDYNISNNNINTHTKGQTEYFSVGFQESQEVMGFVQIDKTPLVMSLAELTAFDRRCKGLNLSQENISEIIGMTISEFAAQVAQGNRGAITRGGKYLGLMLDQFLKLRKSAREVQIADSKHKHYKEKSKPFNGKRKIPIYRGNKLSPNESEAREVINPKGKKQVEKAIDLAMGKTT